MISIKGVAADSGGQPGSDASSLLEAPAAAELGCSAGAATAALRHVDLHMADTFADKLAGLGFALPEGHTAPSEKLVRAFQRRFGIYLPADYRSFLVRHGGVQGDARCPMIEPTPFGTSTIITGFYGFHDDEIGETTDLIEGGPEIIGLGSECLGRMFWLFCAEPYVGHVFVRDHYGRSSWSDEDFFKWPHLAPEIRHYLDLRREGKLPKKPEGFEDVYLVARSFTAFIESLKPHSEAAKPDATPDRGGS